MRLSQAEQSKSSDGAFSAIADEEIPLFHLFLTPTNASVAATGENAQRRFYFPLGDTLGKISKTRRVSYDSYTAQR